MAGNAFFDSNTAAVGGAVSLFLTCALQLDGVTTFVNNNATSSGGAIFALDLSVVGLASYVRFDSNNAETGGGVYALNGTEVHLHGETVYFVNNRVSTWGGAVAVQINGLLNITGSATFAYNRASLSGGALFLDEGSEIEIDGTDVDFFSNVSPTGGALHISIGQGYITGARFRSNRGVTGGAVALFSVGTDATRFSFNNCDFVGNSADDGSGGAALFSGGFVSLTYCNFTKNWAGKREPSELFRRATEAATSVLTQHLCLNILWIIVFRCDIRSECD